MVKPYTNKMYINDTNIVIYIFTAIIGLVVGQFVDWMNKRLPESKKVFSTDIFREYKIQFKPNYILMILTSFIYVGLIYNFGIQNNFIGNLNLIKYLLLVPLILSSFVIDFKFKIIPDRLNLTMFEIGIVIAFLYGFSNVAITIDLIFAMLVGGLIFLLIAIVGKMIYGKEAMGFGDVKFMMTLGLYFGLTNIILISIMSFLIGAVIAIILLVCRIKKSDEHIAFAPFIVISTLICIFVPTELIISIIRTIFTFGIYKG